MQLEIERFIDWVRMRSPQARTWRDYKCDLSLFMNVVQKDDVRAIRPGDLDNFVSFQAGKGYKPSTINRRLAAIASFYMFLIAEGYQVACPVLPKRHYLQEPKRLPRPVNEQDLRKFFGAVQDPRDRAMFTLMLRCGLRIAEVAESKMSDLYLGASSSRMIVHGKGARERIVYLSPNTERELQNWLATRPKVNCEHIFTSYQQKKLSTTSISIRINQARRMSGVELTAHRLRHTFADQLLSAGMPITSIQKLMGHRFIETTQNYAVANDWQVQMDFYAASEKLEGWKLWMHTTDMENVEENADSPAETQFTQANTAFETAVAPMHFETPASLSGLPMKLVSQLALYHQWKTNRWRPERIKPNSIHFYSQHRIMWCFFMESCAVKTVGDLQLPHILQYVKYRLEAGYSASTVNNHLSSLRSFLLYLKEDGVDIHPSIESIQRLKEVERLPRYMTSEQVRLLQEKIEADVSDAKNKMERYDLLLIRAVFYLLWQGGLRVGEIEELRFSDFYISGFNQAKRLFIRDSKWRKGRTVYLTDVALDALKTYLAVRGRENAGGYVFVRNGAPMRKNLLCTRLKSIGRQVGLIVSPHRLRHTFATQLLNVGCRVTSIQKLLGHSNLNTTMTYAQAFDQTVMLDYFRAVDVMESRPDGAWFRLDNTATTPD